MPAQQKPNAMQPENSPSCSSCRSKLELGSLLCATCEDAQPSPSSDLVPEELRCGLINSPSYPELKEILSKTAPASSVREGVFCSRCPALAGCSKFFN